MQNVGSDTTFPSRDFETCAGQYFASLRPNHFKGKVLRCFAKQSFLFESCFWRKEQDHHIHMQARMKRMCLLVEVSIEFKVAIWVHPDFVPCFIRNNASLYDPSLSVHPSVHVVFRSCCLSTHCLSGSPSVGTFLNPSVAGCWQRSTGGALPRRMSSATLFLFESIIYIPTYIFKTILLCPKMSLDLFSFFEMRRP